VGCDVPVWIQQTYPGHRLVGQVPLTAGFTQQVAGLEHRLVGVVLTERRGQVGAHEAEASAWAVTRIVAAVEMSVASCGAAQGQADRTESGGRGDAHGQQGGRWGLLAGVAGRSGGRGQAGSVCQHVAAENAGEGHGQGVGQGDLGGVADQAGDGGVQQLPQGVPEAGELLGFGGQVGAGKVAGGAEADDASDVLGTGSQPVFLPGAQQDRVDRGAGPSVEGADAFGGVALVAGDGQQVHVQVGDVDVDFADGLGGVGVDHGPGPWAWAAMSPTGKIAPVSFCASIIVTRATSGPIAAAAVAVSIEPAGLPGGG